MAPLCPCRESSPRTPASSQSLSGRAGPSQSHRGRAWGSPSDNAISARARKRRCVAALLGYSPVCVSRDGRGWGGSWAGPERGGRGTVDPATSVSFLRVFSFWFSVLISLPLVSGARSHLFPSPWSRLLQFRARKRGLVSERGGPKRGLAIPRGY